MHSSWGLLLLILFNWKQGSCKGAVPRNFHPGKAPVDVRGVPSGFCERDIAAGKICCAADCGRCIKRYGIHGWVLSKEYLGCCASDSDKACFIPGSMRNVSASAALIVPLGNTSVDNTSVPFGNTRVGIATVAQQSFSRVAILSVGLERTMLYPEVVASLNLMKSGSLVDPRINFSLFLFVSTTGTSDANPAALEALRGRLELAYRPRKLWLSADDLECATCGVNSALTGRSKTMKCDGRNHDSPFRLLQQFYKLHLAFGALQDYEARSGEPSFDWIVKVRTDLIYFEPLPLEPFLLGASLVFVPHGVMTRDPTQQLHNDHIFLCPRELCRPYFSQMVKNYQTCSGPVGKEDMLHNSYGGRLGLIEFGYTIARQDEAMCRRLPCGRQAHNTGCVAQHLTQFYDKCMDMNKKWNHKGQRR